MTRAADYAVRVMVHLSSQRDRSRASLADLASSVDVPPTFLSKVLQRLVKAGLVVSRRGKRGGFELARDVATVSLLDVLYALDSVPTLNACVVPKGCARTATCGAHVIWLEAQDRLREVLAGASLARIADITRARQHAVAGHGRSGLPLATRRSAGRCAPGGSRHATSTNTTGR